MTNLTVRFGDYTVVDNVSFTVSPGEWLMIVGPNGAGKSSIISAISQAVPYTGTVAFNGRDIRSLKSKDVAKCFGVLTQKHAVGYSFTVEEVVRLGRYSFSGGFFSRNEEVSEAIIEKALRMTGLEALRNQSVLTLSGGELQRAFLAQVLAQDPPLLILDEPTNHLDLVYQRQIFELISQWVQETERAVVSVVHDLSLARKYGTTALLMHKGKLVGHGPVNDVIDSEHIDPVYSMDVRQWMVDLLSQWQKEGGGT
ncbi:MAG TPA: ABC transporter ATP-binding protein [Papillibacter sp.]|nr:ABC transporter ATP-binding protein [Papillibacter sp.]